MERSDAQNNPAAKSDSALDRLISGNRRYALNAGIHPNQTPDRREETLVDQHPFAAVLTCADSRVPPEIIFDCGLGDICVARSAGHVLDDVILGSLQFAAEYLGVELILVLGHTHCAAVNAAVEGQQISHSLGMLLEMLQPAVTATRGQNGNPLQNAIVKNVGLAVQLLQTQPWNKKPSVRGALYNLQSGLVTLID